MFKAYLLKSRLYDLHLNQLLTKERTMITLRVLVNPEHFKNWRHYAGLIPEFIDGDAKTVEEQTQAMCDAYGFGRHEMGGTVDPDKGFIYQYPEDPDLEPICVFITSKYIHVCVYAHGIVAICDPYGANKEQIVIRMD